MEHHSAITHAAYHDLLRSLKDEAVSNIRGTPRLELRNGKKYWYDVYRTGSAVQKRYIGEDTPELSILIGQHKTLAEGRSARNAARARLIRILRAEGVQTTDPATGSLLATLADAGTFRLGGTLVGTYAFRQYEAELNIRVGLTDIIQTSDIDIARFERLSLALQDELETPLSKTFAHLDFAPMPSLGKSVWRWQQTKSNTLIEFLTPSFRDAEDIRDLPALGVSAQSLHFLNYLIASPIPAAALYRSGVLVQIPRPERYAIHKLIVADRRSGGPDAIKSRKDRLQATFLIRALAKDRPDDLRDAYLDALANGPSWRDHIARSLKRMPEVAAVLQSL